MESWSNIHKWVVRYGDEQEVDLNEFEELIQNEGIDIVTPSGSTILHLCAISDVSLCLKYIVLRAPHLINKKNYMGETALHWACSKGRLSNVKTLLKHGANPKVRDLEGNSILHFAVKGGRKDTVKYILYNNLVRTNLQNKFGLTALTVAEEEHEKTLIVLLTAYNPIRRKNHKNHKKIVC